MRYPGGKFKCFQKLINLIPPHRVYIETHLGGGAVLRNKLPAELTFGIDRDAAVIEAFRGHFDARYRFIVGTAEKFLSEFDFQGDELIYADPPYWPQSKRSPRKYYRYEYSECDHVNLLALLKQLPCRVMISGYTNPEYNRKLSGWHKYSFDGTSHAGRRKEHVWMNFQPTLVHDTRFLGETFRTRQSIKRKRTRWAKKFSSEPIPVQQAVITDFTAILNRQLHHQYGNP